MQNNFDAGIFAKRVLITAGIIIPILLLVWLFGAIFYILLLVFAAILVTCFFKGIARFIHNKTKLSKGWALLVSIIGVLGILFLGNLFLAPHVAEQVNQLSEQLPQSLENARSFLEQQWWGVYVLNQIPQNFGTFMQDQSGLMKKTLGIFSAAFGILGNIYVVLLLAIYFIVNPFPYASGFVALFPISKRDRIREIIYKIYITLQRWLEGKLISMLIVAVLTIIGLYILGIPLALTLGLFAGFLSFIPNFGPIIALIPAILVAFTQGPNAVWQVIVLYILVQLLESNVTNPIIQRRMVDLPFAMIVLAQVVLGVLTGILGLILATPLVACVIVVVKMLYVQDVIGDDSVEVQY